MSELKLTADANPIRRAWWTPPPSISMHSSRIRAFLAVLAGVALLGACSSEGNPVSVDGSAIESSVGGEDSGITASAGGVLASATTSTVRTENALNVTFPVPCVGEDVNLSGPVQVRIHTTIDPSGRPHQMAYYNWKDVVATGLTSGETWRTTASLELYTLQNFDPVEPHQPFPGRTPLGDPAVFHHSGAIRFLSNGDAPDLYVRHLIQVVIDANGDVRVENDLLELLRCV